METTEPPARAPKVTAQHRSRWAAIGAAIAVTFGGGTLLGASAANDAAPANFVSIAPCRVVDTRPSTNVGTRNTPLGSAETYSTAFVGAAGQCNIPATATAVVLSLVVVNPTAPSYLTVYPAGGSVPNASNLNYSGGQGPTANSATVRIGDAGKLSFYNFNGAADIVADVSGYFVPYVPAVPGVSKSQQIGFGTHAVVWTTPGSIGTTIHGCTTRQSGTTVGTISLDLPVGASIESLSAVMWDDSNPSGYLLDLYRERTGGVGLATDGPLLEISGGAKSNMTSTDSVSSSTPFVVTATDKYYLGVNLGNLSGNALCSLTMTVTMP